MISTQLHPPLDFPFWEKSVPDSENLNKFNGLFGIQEYLLELKSHNFGTPKEKPMKNLFVKMLIVGVLLFSGSLASSADGGKFDTPGCIPTPQYPNCPL